MAKCFNGFPGFDCRENIWWGVFRSNAYGGSERLRELLSMPEYLDASVFSRKQKGDVAWSGEEDAFLRYSESAGEYSSKWLAKLVCPVGCLNLFRRFIASVPAESPGPEYDRFLPPAKKLCTYLEQILLHCGASPTDSERWTAAGMYALTAFFLQNGKTTVPRFYCPPKEYDPVTTVENALIVPDVVMNPPEDEEIQFDFFLTMRKRYEEMFGKEAKENSNDGFREETSDKICLASARLELRPFSSDFTIIDPEGMTTYAYLVVEYLSFEEGKWCLREMMRQIPYETEPRDDHLEAHKFLVANDLLLEDDCHIILLTVAHDGSKALLNTAVFTGDDKMYVSENSTKVCMEEPSLYISRVPTQIDIVEIDENGHQRNDDLEYLMGYCNVGGLDQELPTRWKKATSDFDPAYLQYLILDVQGKKEISKTISRDPVTGAYKIHATLPCPGKLITMEVTPEGGNAVSYALAGYLHGAYGLKKNHQKAEELMRESTEKDDPVMAFEYGAYLRTKGKHKEAEKYLRQAAQANIAGAQFELAELLKDRGSPEDIKEARQLLNMLWKKGCRTYGEKSVHISCIDLSAENADQSNEAVHAVDNIFKVTPAQLIYNICKYFGVDEVSLKGRNRTREVSEARGVAMYLMKQMCGIGYYEIGRIFGRDSTASRHIIEQIEKNLQVKDNKYDAIVQDLKSSLDNPDASFEHSN